MSVPLRVLIVEDSEDDTLLMLLELRRNGYEPTSERVDSAEAMSAALDRQTWDLILSDYAMPRFSMSAALTMVQEKGLDLPFIVVSGAIGEEAAVAAMRAGAHDYVMKGNITRLAPAVERELREAEMRRERRRAEQERERLLAELEDKSKELGQLLFVASHDLQEPLVNIQGFAREMELSLQQVHSVLESEDIPSAVKEKLAVTIDEDITDSLNYILASTSKIDTLLKGLLKVSRLGRATLTIEKLNMKDLMAKVVESFEFQTRKAGVKLEVGRLPQCQGDRVQINQVFSNLIGNALKYLDPERPGIIRISGRKEDNKAVYTVEDNGIGIAPEHHEAVFQIFQRVDPRASSGEGLGLTIVRHILERHGGKTWLESELGRGSRFHVSLPIRD
jgi:signal transduction histidine kinase